MQLCNNEHVRRSVTQWSEIMGRYQQSGLEVGTFMPQRAWGYGRSRNGSGGCGAKTKSRDS